MRIEIPVTKSNFRQKLQNRFTPQRNAYSHANGIPIPIRRNPYSHPNGMSILIDRNTQWARAAQRVLLARVESIEEPSGDTPPGVVM
jgi:hypothetical protein